MMGCTLADTRESIFFWEEAPRWLQEIQQIEAHKRNTRGRINFMAGVYLDECAFAALTRESARAFTLSAKCRLQAALMALLAESIRIAARESTLAWITDRSMPASVLTEQAVRNIPAERRHNGIKNFLFITE